MTEKINIYGPIMKEDLWGWFPEDGYTSSAGIAKKLAEYAGKDIEVHINSGGGDVFESIAILNQLLQHDGKVVTIIDGLAGSGASIIATAGEEIRMFPTSMQMIHRAWTVVYGNADELRKTAGDLDKIDSAVAAAYKDRFVGTEAELSELLSAETWLTAEECLAFGFCTEVVKAESSSTEPNPDDEPDTSADVKKTLFNKYQSTVQNEIKPIEEPKKNSLLGRMKQC